MVLAFLVVVCLQSVGFVISEILQRIINYIPTFLGVEKERRDMEGSMNLRPRSGQYEQCH